MGVIKPSTLKMYSPDDSDDGDEIIINAEEQSQSQETTEEMIPLISETWELAAKTYSGFVRSFRPSTFSNGKLCWLVEIEVDNEGVIFKSKVPHELTRSRGLGMAIAQLKKPCPKIFVGKHIAFSITKSDAYGKTFSNISSSKLLQK